MGTWITINNFIGSGKSIFTPNALNPVFWLKDLTTPINGYWKDYSGKNKQIQAATTTVANDSLIMPANDTDIINALTALGVYSKYYTNNSTPKTVLVSQIASIDANYRVFFDAKNKKNFTLFGSAGNEYRADKMYEYTFKAYTGGYFPITQTNDSISFVIRGTGTFVFDWGDGTTTSYTLTTGADTTISKTWTTNLGGQKNISVIGTVKNWSKISKASKSLDDEIIRISSMNISYLSIGSCPKYNMIGSINNMPISYFNLNNCNMVNISGYVNNMQFTTFIFNNNSKLSGTILSNVLSDLEIYGSDNIDVTADISYMPLTKLVLFNCLKTNIYGDISGKSLIIINIFNCPLNNFYGNIDSISSSASLINIDQKNRINYDGGALKPWAISITIQCAWPTSMIDLFLKNFNIIAPVVTNKNLILKGSNSVRSSNSDSDALSLISKGWILQTNNISIHEGDSITYGTGASPLTNRYTSLYCKSKGITEINNGVGGKRMSNNNGAVPLSFIETMINTPIYTEGSTIKLAFGINDINQSVSVDDYISNYRTALNFLINQKNYPLSKIYVISIYYTSYYKTLAIPYNNALYNLTNEIGVRYIDVYTNCQGGGEIDGVHPDNARYSIIASYLESQIND